MNAITLNGSGLRPLRILAISLCMIFLSACQTNPVTGERHFQIYGADWEQGVGGQMYSPLKQSQGGDFVMDPELTRYVSGVGERLAKQARRQDELQFEFSVLNNSTPNAWALPGGKIVINRGLLVELESEAELAAVLGHEIVHADAAHGARQQSTGMLAQVGAVASMIVLGTKVKNESAREIAMLLPGVGSQLIMRRYGRDAERESDEYGMLYMSEAGYDPQGAVELQETFVELSAERKEDWLSGMFASHPPSRERVQNNKETAAELPTGGEVGRDRYQQKIAYLKRVQPAYDAYDEAEKAMREDDISLAQKKLKRAIKIEPREALFMALQGDIDRQQGKTRAALRNYDRTIRANPGLFYGYLRKGQTEFELERFKPARENLEKSLALLPTSEAHYMLGQLDARAGNNSAAIEHYTQAAQSQTEAGKKAQGELVRLDLAQNPSKYIVTQAARDSEGYIWVQLGNRTNVPMRNIDLSYQWIDDSGQTRQDKVVFRGPLAGGQQDRVRLKVRLSETSDLSRRFRVGATAAAVAE